MVIRKIFYNGSSLLVAVPPTYFSAIGCANGDYVAVELQSTGSIKLTKVNPTDTKLAKKLPKQEG